MSIRYYFATNSRRKISNLQKKPSNQRILAILPFRNEESIIEKTLPRVISETSSDKNCHLVLVNSASEDNSVEVVVRTIRESVLGDDSWTLINLKKPGKGYHELYPFLPARPERSSDNGSHPSASAVRPSAWNRSDKGVGRKA